MCAHDAACEHSETVTRTVPKSTFRFARSADDRMIAGVAAGVAHRLGIDPTAVRAAFALLTLTGGVGVALYLAGFAIAETGSAPGRVTVERPRDRSIAILLFTGAAFLMFRRAGIWIGDALAWPLALVIVGSLIVWMRRPIGADGPQQLTSLLRTNSIPRAIIGLVVVLIGFVGLAAAAGSVSDIGAVAAALVTLLVGAALVGAPFVSRLTTELADERRTRIRSAERAEVSAHLHDSVLQTLALIQRHADDPRTTARLARRQERELRAWLLGSRSEASASLREAVAAAAESIEDDHGLRVDIVQTGNARCDATTDALVAALKETLTNVAKHAHVEAVSVFVEASATAVTVYVRDRGVGFDVAAIPPDRRGLSESIIARVRRHGGSVEVVSAPGNGTEITLTVPLTESRP